MRPEEFEHFMIVDQGTAMKLQDDIRLVICPIKDMQETIVYNGMQIYPLGYMVQLGYPEGDPSIKRADIFDRTDKIGIFVDPLAPFHE